MKSINKSDFALNKILDEGLYIKDHDQLMFLARKYARKNSIKFSKINELIDIVINDSHNFVNFIKEKYGIRRSEASHKRQGVTSTKYRKDS